MKQLFFFFICCLCISAANAQKGHHTRMHEMALRRCNKDYIVAANRAHHLRGRLRAEALIRAREERERCMAKAPW